MNKEITDLVDISRYYGRKKDYALGGGGNTSYKDRKRLYVKASGYSLADITEEGFAILDRDKLAAIMTRPYSSDVRRREQEVTADLLSSLVPGQKQVRPSVEASLHDLIRYPFVVHTHPFLINALLCANDVEIAIKELFDENVLYVPYTDPGYVLSKTVSDLIEKHRRKHRTDPRIIFLQNHGVFVGADSIREIREIYDSIMKRIMERTGAIIDIAPIDYEGPVDRIMAILSDALAEGSRFRYGFDSLVAHFTKDKDSIARISKPFIPDQIVYCRANPAVIPISGEFAISPESIGTSISDYREKHGSDPKVIIVEKGPVIAVDKNERSAGLVLDVFLDAMKISFYSNFFGGPHFMNDEQVVFIENWEAEHYRRKVSTDDPG